MDEETKFKIFHPYASRVIESTMSDAQAKFVYYTSAETAFQIVQNEEIWMRKTALMNDYREGDYGMARLGEAWRSHGADLIETVDAMFPGLTAETMSEFDLRRANYLFGTFIACISKHLPEEDSLGRLSMWRAYGGKAGVALVCNKRLFDLHANSGLWSSPVLYAGTSRFDTEFSNFVKSIKTNSAALAELARDEFKYSLNHAFAAAVLCTKHKGFAEEQEWRVVLNPSPNGFSGVKWESRTIGGIPQMIIRVPLKREATEEEAEVRFIDLLDHIIIGPTAFPNDIREAFMHALFKKGIPDPQPLVHRSDIPLRNF